MRLLHRIENDPFVLAWFVIAGLLMLGFIANSACKRTNEAQREASVSSSMGEA